MPSDNKFLEEEINAFKRVLEEVKNAQQTLDVYGGMTGQSFMAEAATWNYDPQKDRAFNKLRGAK